MFNQELSRAVESDRRREIERHLEHRRAMHDQAGADRADTRPDAMLRQSPRTDAALRPSR